jgi:hypothetical protein
MATWGLKSARPAGCEKEVVDQERLATEKEYRMLPPHSAARWYLPAESIAAATWVQ